MMKTPVVAIEKSLNKADLIDVDGDIYLKILDRIRDENNLSGIVPFVVGDDVGYFRDFGKTGPCMELRIPERVFDELTVDGKLELKIQMKENENGSFLVYHSNE